MYIWFIIYKLTNVSLVLCTNVAIPSEVWAWQSSGDVWSWGCVRVPPSYGWFIWKMDGNPKQEWMNMDEPYVAYDAFLTDTFWQLFLSDTCIVAAQHSIETAAPCRFWSSHDSSTKKCRYGKWSGIPEHSLINHHELILCQPKPDSG